MDFGEIFREFMAEYGMTILSTIFTALAGYIGITVKRLYSKHINDKTKESVVKTCVSAAEQMYKDLHGEEKLAKCIEAISGMLGEKGIKITELEIRMLIESAVGEFNTAFGKNRREEEAPKRLE